MSKKLSLRVKLTLITTLIMVIISLILTIVSVYNANYGFFSMLSTIENEESQNYDVDSGVDLAQGSESIIPDNTIKVVPEVGVMTREAWTTQMLLPFNSNMAASISIAPTELTVATQAVDSFKSNAILYMIIIIIVGSIFIYLILGKILKPVKILSNEIEIINEHKLSQRVSSFNNGDEISELANSFNNMLDRLDKAFEGQKRFSSDAAHELKTPLTALKTNLDILALDENPSDEEYKHIVSIFKKQTERMIDLVNNLFVLSVQKDYNFNDVVKINGIVDDVLNDLKVEITNKNLTVDFKDKDITLKGNKTMLTHSISNIIQNAVKYNNDNGKIFINIKEENKRCCVEIKDTGIGIPKDKEAHIFDAFYRVDTSRSRKIGGAGLGLAITKDIVNSHGGEIKYFPNKEGGSIFIIELPIIN